MKREIKFRAWIGHKMEYNVVAGHLGAFYALIDPKDSACLNPTTIYYGGTPIMQYTGVKDKNGAEIYEGDILKYTTNFVHRGVVRFYAGAFFVEWTDQTDEMVGYLQTEKLEAMGNIYENATCLKGD